MDRIMEQWMAVLVLAGFILFGWLIRDDDDAIVLVPVLALFGGAVILENPFVLALSTIMLSLAILVGFAEWIKRTMSR